MEETTPQNIDELCELGFSPPTSAQDAEASATALPDVAVPSSLPSLAVVLDKTQWSMPGLASGNQAFLAQEPLLEHTASTAFTPGIAPKTKTETTTMTDDELEKIEEWCKEDLVSLPFASLPASDGMIDPFTDTELQEAQQHLHSGHLKKTNLCRGCLEPEGPRKLHRIVREVDLATHTLHIDIAGPFTVFDDGFTYFLAGALRTPGFPLMIDVRNLTSRTSTEVCDELEKMVAFFESLQSEGFTIGETSRIKRLLTVTEQESSLHLKTIRPSFTSGYDPQANGTAERAVGLVKPLASRCLCATKLEGTYWSLAVRYAAQSLLRNALQLRQKSLPFGTSVVAQVLGHKDVRFPQPRSLTGRLLVWDHLHDSTSYILCPPEDDTSATSSWSQLG